VRRWVRLARVLLAVALLFVLGGCFGRNQPPQASFTLSPPAGEAPLMVSFDASASSDPDGEIVSYSWDFGDGDRGEGVQVTHEYQVPGTFRVVLTVVDDRGAEDTAEGEVQVRLPPVPPPPGG